MAVPILPDLSPPFEVRLDAGKAIVSARDGVRYSVLIDGARIVEIDSKGTDEITLGNLP